MVGLGVSAILAYLEFLDAVEMSDEVSPFSSHSDWATSPPSVCLNLSCVGVCICRSGLLLVRQAGPLLDCHSSIESTLMTDPCSFEDQVRINRVRDALWGVGSNGASVMVGAGFSKNAEIRQPDRVRLPDWADLTTAMHRELHPDARADATVASGTMDAPAIAQDYSDEFGRAQLHRFLRDQIRDDEIEPSESHRRLLALPWSDVLTTNWDTLLERAAQHVATPGYGVVRATDEIPLVPRPRILKLHGSLPANFPLVATTKDYENYREESAAFVNTARQAMMETVFLLLGFSGDDPNFRRWSQWVQGELGESAPKIYLAGWLELDEDRRQELEGTHVMPIDLARHPQREHWRKHDRMHEFALEWVLRSLEAGQPYPTEEWPKALAPAAAVPKHLEPVDVTAWDAPKAAVALVGSEEDALAREANVEEVVAGWIHNRKLYPGWLTLPERTRRELLDPWMRDVTGDLLQTDKENALLEIIEGKPLQTRLRAVYEIVWRREIRLEPMGAALGQAAEDLLKEIRNGLAEKGQTEIDRTLTTRIALALVTRQRLQFDTEGFQAAVSLAEEFGLYDVEATHRLSYEKCLMALYEADQEALGRALDEWEVGVGDPFWGVRKSALMFEGDQYGENALPLLQESIAQLRGSREGSARISALSREAWASYLAKTLESTSWSGGSGTPAYRSRARELARFNCDPESEIGALSSAIEYRGEPEGEKGPEFDLGGRPATRTIRFQASDIPSPEERRARTAFRLMRLTEVVGLPSLADRWPPTKHMLGKASEAFYRDGQVELALRLMLRIAQNSDDDLLKRLMSRPNIAALPDPVVGSVVAACERTVRYHQEQGINRVAKKGVVAARERVGVAMECLSRLVLRLDAKRAGHVMRLALACYETKAFYTETLLRTEIRNLLTRSWEALSEHDRTDFVFELLNAPIVGLDGFSPNPYLFVDPGELIDGQDVRLPCRDGDTEADWARCVQFLVKGLAGEAETRWRAMIRLIPVAMADCLMPGEREVVASAIWPGGDDATDGPAGEEKFRPWVYFCMPQPAPGTALRWFRRKWMSGDGPGIADGGSLLDQALYAIGDTKERSVSKGFSFDLSREDEALVVKLLKRWSQLAVPEFMLLADLDGRRSAEANQAVWGVAVLLMYVDVPDSVAKGLMAKCSPLDDANVSPLSMLVGLSRSRKDLRERTVGSIREALLADERKSVGDGTSALQCWLHFANLDLLKGPPDDLMGELGAIVQTRRTVALPSALRIVEWIFDNGQKRHQILLKTPVTMGLASLLPSLRYEGAELGSGQFDVPLLRWRCVGIARTLAKAGSRDEPVLAWIKQGREDHLPEVRRRISDVTQ